MFIQSEVYAKPGELIQGALAGSKRFLLSNKSSRLFKSTAEVGVGRFAEKQGLRYKSKNAIELFWSSLPEKKRSTDISKLYVKQESNIPVGKGLSSSSADVLGLLAALSTFYKTGYNKQLLYDLAAAIEPTDPCLHPGNLVFDQDSGTIRQELLLLPYQCIYFDSDKEEQVDTVNLSQSVRYSEKDQQLYEQLCKQIELAGKEKNYELFNYCLNKSAELNQHFLPKKNFEILQEFASENNVGLFVAHSGTYMGLVVEPSCFKNIKEKASTLIKRNWDTTIYME